jgi:hypothetical protein
MSNPAKLPTAIPIIVVKDRLLDSEEEVFCPGFAELVGPATPPPADVFAGPPVPVVVAGTDAGNAAGYPF